MDLRLNSPCDGMYADSMYSLTGQSGVRSRDRDRTAAVGAVTYPNANRGQRDKMPERTTEVFTNSFASPHMWVKQMIESLGQGVLPRPVVTAVFRHSLNNDSQGHQSTDIHKYSNLLTLHPLFPIPVSAQKGIMSLEQTHTCSVRVLWDSPEFHRLMIQPIN